MKAAFIVLVVEDEQRLMLQDGERLGEKRCQAPNLWGRRDGLFIGSLRVVIAPTALG
jgi:hypothetical protein